MDNRLNIKLSSPLDKNLSEQQLETVKVFQQLLEKERFRVLKNLETDRIEEQYSRIQHCQGVIVVAFSQWQASRLFRDENKKRIIPSEYAHITNVMALTAKKPLLVFREKNVAERGTLAPGYIHPVIDLPVNTQLSWFQTQSFRDPFEEWLKRVREYHHIFLGYSSKAQQTALAVRVFFENTLKLSVLDWHDYHASGVIVQNLEKSERLTMCGVFLFMEDDTIESDALRLGAPRDNVIYEAGFFAGAKGQANTLIIKESRAKIPTDLGGVIYLELTDRNNIAPIETKLRESIESILSY
jgi:predicted nucleotide-binding protein with TIR-like domain